MTLQEFCEINGRNQTYDEMEVYDERGNELLSWVDDDPKYGAEITKFYPLSDTLVKVVIKYKGE